MKKFTLIGILAAAESFSREKGATQNLEKSLRDIESEKQSKNPTDVTSTDEASLYAAFAEVVAAHCLSKVVDAVINKYTELGHEINEVR